MTVKGTWLLLEALGIAGFIAVYHNGPPWLIPPYRPFICAFCLSFLIPVGYFSYSPTVEHFWLMGVCPLLVGTLTGFVPWLYLELPEEPGASDQTSDTSHKNLPLPPDE